MKFFGFPLGSEFWTFYSFKRNYQRYSVSICWPGNCDSTQSSNTFRPLKSEPRHTFFFAAGLKLLLLNYLPSREKRALGGGRSGEGRQLLIRHAPRAFLFKENVIKVDVDGVGLCSAGHYSVWHESKVVSPASSLFMKCQQGMRPEHFCRNASRLYAAACCLFLCLTRWRCHR